ncbi:hypothetical protein [Prescottella agglutinans]|uniref:Uncharacterized protein n=1 Tax=Prescottella agglutinans TaxID=1644129 RepID=A0ABT6M7K5_9NOCA|nr:hypothetical protein [Prescottella agglutinans]MDH6280292.1 hypothetical protein [Prescottella agglutinans]
MGSISMLGELVQVFAQLMTLMGGQGNGGTGGGGLGGLGGGGLGGLGGGSLGS